MRDGLYLSIYSFVNPRPHIYLNGIRHSCNLSLWEKKGDTIQLIEYYELERYSGEKQHKYGFQSLEEAEAFIQNILSRRGLSLSNIVEIWGTPPFYKSSADLLDAQKEFAYHTISHLFSVLLSDTEKFYKEKILALAPDGGPDVYIDVNALRKHSYAGAYSNCGIINMFPISSPAKIWSYLSNFWDSREGTLMALAYANTCRFIGPQDLPLHIYNGVINNEEVESLIKYFLHIKKRESSVRLEDKNITFKGYDSRFTFEENIHSMTMKQVQEMSIQVMCDNIQMQIDKFSIDPRETYLAISGGYALNCPSNSYLMKKYKFKGFIGIPCPDDSGQSLGIALYEFYKGMPKMKFALKHAYYGYQNHNVMNILSNKEFVHFIDSITPFSLEQAVDDICAMPIVWVNGPAEIGPRALGNRSLLGDPRYLSTKDFLNSVKQREWWRPIAPVVLIEDMNAWFEEARESPFMLSIFNIRKECLSKIPAIAHHDSSARVQTVALSDNEDLYYLIAAFKKKTGIPMLCNTSLNDKGEPIINTKEQALNFALRKRIPIVYINKIRIKLKNFDNYTYNKPLKRELIVPPEAKAQTKTTGMDLINPYKVDNNIFSQILDSGMLREYNFSHNSQVREFTKKIFEMIDNHKN